MPIMEPPKWKGFQGANGAEIKHHGEREIVIGEEKKRITVEDEAELIIKIKSPMFPSREAIEEHCLGGHEVMLFTEIGARFAFKLGEKGCPQEGWQATADDAGIFVRLLFSCGRDVMRRSRKISGSWMATTVPQRG